MDHEKLAKYQIWADDIVRILLKELSDEDFNSDILPPYGSIRNLTIHIIIALEYNIEKRVLGNDVDPSELYNNLLKQNKDELIKKWIDVDNKLLEYASSGTNEPYTYPNFLGEGEISVTSNDFFLQYIFHTLHHRGQIMSALRLLGKEAKTTDYLFYLSNLET